MKFLLRNIAINAFSLFALSQFIDGVRISGGFPAFIFGGLVLALMNAIIRPILKIITFPINALTFGAFSFIINAIILYLLTITVPNISVSAFTFKGVNFLGFVIPQIYFSAFFAFIVSAFILSSVISFFRWIVND